MSCCSLWPTRHGNKDKEAIIEKIRSSLRSSYLKMEQLGLILNKLSRCEEDVIIKHTHEGDRPTWSERLDEELAIRHLKIWVKWPLCVGGSAKNTSSQVFKWQSLVFGQAFCQRTVTSKLGLEYNKHNGRLRQKWHCIGLRLQSVMATNILLPASLPTHHPDC